MLDRSAERAGEDEVGAVLADLRHVGRQRQHLLADDRLRVGRRVDAVLLKPVATLYREKVPPLVRTGVSNFFGNLSDVWSAANR